MHAALRRQVSACKQINGNTVQVGWKHGALIERLESQRKVKSEAFHKKKARRLTLSGVRVWGLAAGQPLNMRKKASHARGKRKMLSNGLQGPMKHLMLPGKVMIGSAFETNMSGQVAAKRARSEASVSAAIFVRDIVSN